MKEPSKYAFYCNEDLALNYWHREISQEEAATLIRKSLQYYLEAQKLEKEGYTIEALKRNVKINLHT